MATFVGSSGPAATPAMSNHLVMSTAAYHHRTKTNHLYTQGFPPPSFSQNTFDRERQTSPSGMTSTSSTPQRKISRGESIHSGHFMVSEIEETESEEQQVISTSKKSPEETEISDYEGSNQQQQLLQEEENRLVSYADYSNENTQMSTLSNSSYNAYKSNFNSGVRSSGVHFDSSLTKLFESMRLAYSGKITSPKWKTFKGLKLHIKDKIRLNNIIWRAWHIQYIAGRNPVVCQFSSSADSKRHKRTEAILLEGKYWKRRIDAVKEEYKKWRTYHHKGAGPQTPSRPSDFDWELSLPRWSNNLSNLDSLFSCEESADFFPTNYINAQNSFGNYSDYNSREIARSGMGAQFMQPGLEQLQPNVDFMDTFEPLHETISRYQNNFALPTVQEESTSFDANSKEQEDLFSSLFPQNTPEGSASSAVQQLSNSVDLLNKPMMETGDNGNNNNNYSTSTLFQTHPNQSMDSSNNLMVSQQPQVVNYGDVLGKLDLSGGNFNFQSNNNQQQQVNIVGLSGGNLQQQQFSSDLMSNNNNSTTIQNSNEQLQQTSFLSSRYQQVQQTEEQQQQLVNIFQPEPGMLTGYGEHGTSEMAKNKGKYFPYYSTSNNSSSGGRSRSRSISMPHGKPAPNAASSTIKSLLNKPSLVSTMGPSEAAGSSMVSSGGTFRVPNAAESTIRANSGSMERSISLPVYSNQERHRKLGIAGNSGGGTNSGMMFLQRLQPENTNSGGSLYEVSGASSFLVNNQQQQLTQSSGTSFFPSMNATSSTSQQQTYSNQETQQLLLPQQTNSSQQLPQIRKVSQTSVEHYIGNKLPDGQFSGNLSFTGNNNNSNLMSNLMGVNVNSSGQLSVFTPHSSSSSSPIGSFDGANGKVNVSTFGGTASPLTFKLCTTTNQQAFLNHQHQLQLQHQQQQQQIQEQQQQKQRSSSPFGMLTKSTSSSNRFKSSSLTDFKDHTQLELTGKAGGNRILSKKPSNLFGSVDFSARSSSKDKNALSDSLQQFLSTTATTSTSEHSLSSLSPLRDSFSFRSFASPPSSSGGPLSPVSSSSGSGLKSEPDRVLYKERRRVCHINAEQKRRCNIKNGFDTLRSLLPSLSSNTNTKVSKAAMLSTAAEYIRQLEAEKYEQVKEYESLKQKVESLNQTISVFQNQLPATGAPVMGQRSSQIKEQYSDYVHSRTMLNWKFWVFSILMESLLDSYCNTVATSNFEEMCKTLLRWLDQSCCLITLRRDVSNSLRYISTNTNILTCPEGLPEEAILAVTTAKTQSKGGNSSKEADDERVRKYSNR